MGAWGVGVFSNDAACDVREDFRDLIAQGLPPEEATARMVEEYGVGQGDDEWDIDFWLALAATQHRLGQIGAGVIERALATCDDPAEGDRWPPKDQKRRARALTDLRAMLTQPPPPPRKLRPRKRVDTSLTVGQHVMMPRDDGTKRVLLRIVDIHEDRGGRYPVAVVVAWDGTDEGAENAARLPPLFLSQALDGAGAYAGFLLVGEPGDSPAAQVLPALADADTPTIMWQPGTVVRWSDIYDFLDRMGWLTYIE